MAGKRRGRFLKWVGPCISFSMVAAAAQTFHRGYPGDPHAQMPRGFRGGERAGKLLIFEPFTLRNAAFVSGSRISWLAKTSPRRRIRLWGALGLRFSQAARLPRFQGLARSLRARRPSGQPVWRPAVRVSAPGDKCGSGRLATPTSRRAWVGRLRPFVPEPNWRLPLQ
jgi:hypothetical protein